jgi:CxxC-x17-CxxC domain-containing protein
MVPFAPRNDKPVYCSGCFDVVRAGGSPGLMA